MAISHSNKENMLVVTIIMIFGFGLYCAYSSEDILHKTKDSFYAWAIAFSIFACSIGCVLLIYETAAYTALIKNDKKEIALEKKTQIDTTYSIKKLK